MFHSLFNPENTFWRWMAGLADILVLSVLWLLCSVRGGRGDAWRRFFHTFRAELKTATIACAIWEALLLVLFWVLRRLWAAALAGVSGAAMLGAAYLVAMLIPVGAFCWMFPILSRFTFRVGGLLWTSIQISLAHLPSTVVIVVFAAAAWIYAGGAGGRGYVGGMSALREKIACHDNLDEKADAGNGPRTVPCIFYKLRERTGEMSVL